MTKKYTIMAFILFGLAGCNEDPEIASKDLFIEASELLESYEALPNSFEIAEYKDKSAILNEILNKFSIIRSDYPESSIGKELLWNDAIGDIKESKIKRELYYIEQYITCSYNLRKCIISNYGLKASYRDFMLIIRLQISLGNLSDAYYMTKQIPEELDRWGEFADMAILLVANAQIEAGALEDARVTLLDGRLGNFQTENYTFRVEYASTVAKSGDIDRARWDFKSMIEDAKDIQNPKKRSEVLIKIASAQLELSDNPGAKSTFAIVETGIEKISDAKIRADLSSALATAKIAPGSLPAEPEVAQSTNGLDPETKLILASVASQATSGNISAALETAQSIKEAWKRVLVLCDVGTAQIASGDQVGASSILLAAWGEAIRIEDVLYSARSRALVAEVAARLK